ncbi:MAG: DUF1365 domain-containing protein [Acidimicrobiia bacterium]|nr:DUF1365 domain-containing protein [Acidimicrobiia bacterium]
MNSALYVGRVAHRRKAPFQHKLRYRTYSMLVDLDELDTIVGRSRLLSRNRWNVFSIHDRDHGARDGTPLRTWIDSQLATAGIDITGGRVEVLLFPRILGYTFNPLTMWFCYDSAGSLRAVLYEIHNTFGHSHSHLVPISGAAPHRHEFAKNLHVSPFFDQDGSYSFTLRPPGDRFSVSIDYSTDDEDLLTATMVGDRTALNDRSLARVFITHPLLTLKVIGGIHWQALRLLLKGARYRPVPAEPEQQVTLESTLVTT